MNRRKQGGNQRGKGNRGRGKNARKARSRAGSFPAHADISPASNWFVQQLRNDLTRPNKGKAARVAALVGLWFGAIAAWTNLILSSMYKVPAAAAGPLLYPPEQIAAMVTLVGSLFATYKLYLDEEGKVLLGSAKASAEAGELEARKNVYSKWERAVQIQDGAICRMYRTQSDPDLSQVTEVIDALLESVKTIFDQVFPESEVLSVNLAVPNSQQNPTALKVLRRWPEGSGATIGRELELTNAEGWGFVSSFNTKEVRYLPDTRGTSSERALYNSVLNVPIFDGTDEKVVGVVNIDSKKQKAFGQGDQKLDERVDLALQLATPTIRLIGLTLLDPKAFSHYRTGVK